jgi:hypothetical protein
MSGLKGPAPTYLGIDSEYPVELHPLAAYPLIVMHFKKVMEDLRLVYQIQNQQ